MNSILRCRASLVFLLFWSASASAQEVCTAVPAATPPNRKVIISDLHLGAGRQASADWHPLEDFRFAPSFARFLVEIGKAGSTDLVIAGDFIDFWQILAEQDASRPAGQGSSEQESLKKLDVVLAGHSETFDALRQFATAGKNRLIIVPGNHDVDLLWPAVQKKLASSIGLAADRLYITSVCYRAEGLHVEHGHQYDEANRFANGTAPFVGTGASQRLDTNWGTTFMSRFYNEVERGRPFIDNLYPELAAIFSSLKQESALAFSLPQAGRLAVMLARDQTSLDNLGFLVRTLGPNDPPPDVPVKSVEALLRLYRDADTDVGNLLEAQLKDAGRRDEASASLKQVDNQEWRDLQAGMVRKPRTLKGAVRIDSLLEAARRIVVRNPEVSAVVMGHSHEIERTDITLLRDVGREEKWYVNTGCWQKALAVRELQARGIPWDKVNLDDDSQFPLRFSYVVVEYVPQGPRKPQRLFWTGR